VPVQLSWHLDVMSFYNSTYFWRILNMLKFFSLIFAWLIFITAADVAAQGPQGPPPLVQVAQIQLMDATQAEKYIGHVEAIESVDLRARVEGYLEKVNFQEGAYVQKGQLLYVIEQKPYKARVASAQARLTQAKANLFKTDTRLRRLRSANPESVPQTDLDDARAAADLAKGQVQEAEASLELARIDLEYTTVEAPADGRIGESFYEQGDLVGPSSGPLAELVSINPIRVLFSAGERDVDLVQKAFSDAQSDDAHSKLTVRIEFPDRSSYDQDGVIEFIDNKMDPDTGTIAVWARFDNPGGELIPGQYVNVFVQPATKDMQPAVPQVAVQRDREGDFVYVVNEGNTVEKRQIQTGAVKDNMFMVTSGLHKDELVIVQGIQKAAPGQRVNIEFKDSKD
jgi:membrane fusion protein (multidrug efflux system)